MRSAHDIIYKDRYLNGQSLVFLNKILSKGNNICNKKTSLRKIVCIKNILKKHTMKIIIIQKWNRIFKDIILRKLLVCNQQVDLGIEWYQ